MRSHLIAFGVGGGLALLAAGVFATVAPHLEGDDDGEGVHIVNLSGGDRGSFHLKEGDRKITAEWKGDFSFSADGRSLTELANRLEIVSGADGARRKAVFLKKDGAIVASAFKGDEALPSGAAADQEAADLLQLFARTSGINADQRVKAMLAAGGKERVIEEIGRLAGGHAVGAYVEALAGAAALSDDEAMGLVARIKTLESDYAKRSAIVALLKSQTLSDATVADIIAAAGTIEGDHELRLIVEALAEMPVSERNFSIATKLIEKIGGDHEVRLAISGLLESENLSDADAARALDAAARTIEGDHEMRLAIEAADERVRDQGVGAAALRAMATIEGGHERRLAIEAFAAALDGPSPLWLPLVALAKGVEGDRERRLTIEAIHSAAPETEEIRSALKDAANSIGAENDRRLALEALE